jgi:hypothetical protein
MARWKAYTSTHLCEEGKENGGVNTATKATGDHNDRNQYLPPSDLMDAG